MTSIFQRVPVQSRDIDCWSSGISYGSSFPDKPDCRCDATISDLLVAEEEMMASWIDAQQDCYDDASLLTDWCSQSVGFDGQSPLLNDCMWSEALLPPSGTTAPTVCAAAGNKTGNQMLSGNGKPADIDVVPAAKSVKDCFSETVNTSEGVATSTDCQLETTRLGALAFTCKTVCTAVKDDDSSEESSDEVDVVSVVQTSAPASVQCKQRRSAAVSGSLVRDLLALPPSMSLHAHVAAMHNYSSQAVGSGGPRRSADYTASGSGAGSSCSASRHPRHRDDPMRLVRSAPQSPLSTAGQQQLDDHRYLSISTPSSPAGISRSHGGQRDVIPRRHSSATLRRPFSDSENSAGTPLPRAVHRRRNNGGGKRALHNVLERRRRDHLKWNFETLRCAVPSAAANARMPKVVILRRARDYVRLLRAAGERLEAERNRLQTLNQHLRAKLCSFVKAV